MLDFTVAICTYNGQNRLPQVLDRLTAQVATENIAWEIIVVDNNSTDRTAEVVKNYQNNQPENCPIVYYFEPQQGLALARQRAILLANGKLVGFIDDDNIPANDWVLTAYNFAIEHPKAGAYGSQVLAAIEGEKPDNFDKIKSFLAIVERGEKAFIYERKTGLLPPGAGLVVYRQAWLENVPKTLFLKGRIDCYNLASEDLEAVLYIQKAGWEIWYNPEMIIEHKIPAHRLERNYLISLIRGIGLARYHIRIIRLKIWQIPLAIPIYLINDLRNLVNYFLKNRKTLKKDLVTACEMEFLASSFLSPFYLGRKYWVILKYKINFKVKKFCQSIIS